jgi:hypothetical protein
VHKIVLSIHKIVIIMHIKLLNVERMNEKHRVTLTEGGSTAAQYKTTFLYEDWSSESWFPS